MVCQVFKYRKYPIDNTAWARPLKHKVKQIVSHPCLKPQPHLSKHRSKSNILSNISDNAIKTKMIEMGGVHTVTITWTQSNLNKTSNSLILSSDFTVDFLSLKQHFYISLETSWKTGLLHPISRLIIWQDNCRNPDFKFLLHTQSW